MAEMSIKLTDNSDLFKEASLEAVQRALEVVGITAEGYAKKKCPVDTGRLRNSITHAVSGSAGGIHNYTDKAGNSFSQSVGASGNATEVTVYIGTNVEYAAYVEMGTVNTRAQPFLRPAASNHSSVYRSLIEDELKGN